MAFQLPELPYSYNALEPHIDEETMQIHHTKHHAGYVDKLNKALESHNDLLNMDIYELMSNFENIPMEIQENVRNNGGGHANHSLFWTIMTPNADSEPTGELVEAINNAFSGFNEFKEKFSEVAATHFGSGWAWLVVNNSQLEIVDTLNQDSPLMSGRYPILGIDVWEHAYYLKYQNKRSDYINAWWNVVNWPQVQTYFKEAIEM